MKDTYQWDPEKNLKLITERGVSFEAVVSQIEEGNILAVVRGKGKYSHQKQFIVTINQYVYVIPYVEKAGRIFLKTIIPSRKLTKRFLLGGKEDEEI